MARAIIGLRPQSAAVRVAFLVIAIALVALLPVAYGNYLPQQLTGYLIFGLFALSVGLISGAGRLFNIGVGATFGIAAYTVAILTQYHVYNPWFLFLGAIGTGFLVSILFGIYAIVASGLEYMMLTFLTTLAFFSLPSVAPALTGGDNGLSARGDLGISFGLNPLLGNDFYFFTLAIVVAAGLISWYFLSSQAGKAMFAIGRNPLRAAAMGYQVGQYRVALTIFSGFLASVAGWLYVLQNAFVFQDLLGLNNSLNGLLYALIGGMETILGPILGAAGLRAFIESISKHSTQSSLYIGAALLVVVYFLPEGVLGLVARLWRRLRPARQEPSAVATQAMEAWSTQPSSHPQEDRGATGPASPNLREPR